LDTLLDLVALGTVADLAPLVGENRRLVRRGLKQMGATTRQGLFALAGVSDVSLARVKAGTIGFMLGPRLNAAGRLDTAKDSLELLTTTDFMRRTGAGSTFRTASARRRHGIQGRLIMLRRMIRRHRFAARELIRRGRPGCPRLGEVHHARRW
jgi:single-stranded-DNA-specific exonuclease